MPYHAPGHTAASLPQVKGRTRKPDDLTHREQIPIVAQEQLAVFVSRVSPGMQNDPVSHDHLPGPPSLSTYTLLALGNLSMLRGWRIF